MFMPRYCTGSGSGPPLVVGQFTFNDLYIVLISNKMA